MTTVPQPDQGLSLPYVTIVDPTLLHQVVFIAPSHGGSIKVSCNCLAYQKSPGGVSHIYMGDSANLDEARKLYNDESKHIKPFGPEWEAKW